MVTKDLNFVKFNLHTFDELAALIKVFFH